MFPCRSGASCPSRLIDGADVTGLAGDVLASIGAVIPRVMKLSVNGFSEFRCREMIVFRVISLGNDACLYVYRRKGFSYSWKQGTVG